MYSSKRERKKKAIARRQEQIKEEKRYFRRERRKSKQERINLAKKIYSKTEKLLKDSGTKVGDIKRGTVESMKDGDNRTVDISISFL